MTVKSLKPFIPSGADFSLSREFFLTLGCTINWEAEGLIEFQLAEISFILQDYVNKELQENLMMQVIVSDLDEFWSGLEASDVLNKFEGARANPPQEMPWGGREIHLIDLAGVCWHFSQ